VLITPPGMRWLYLLAHGAGAGMRHPFMEKVAAALADRGIGTLRYEFPYMAAGRKRVDPPPVCEATIVAAVAEAGRAAPGVPLVAGGKSFGGRMTAYTAASNGLPDVSGLAFLGFPLHAPGKPGITRAEPLEAVRQPMLFLQGTRDEFADLTLLREVVGRLGPRASLHLVEGGDHSFGKRADVFTELAGVMDQWAATTLGIGR
jgi:predicted alpha/beta-hydrolase family hydrolase